MVGAVDWANLTVAGAFVIGAFLATLATLRVVRAVTALFDDIDGRRVRRRRRPPPPDDE